jgi:retron-type reverse transcriptase
MAYGRIYSNDGAMTPGVTQETVDGMSQGKIGRIIDAVRHERYRFSPARRVWIPKKNGKLRPLGMPTWPDKLLGEVVRLLLDAYYEPQFSGRSHGFRPGLGCHTALGEVARTWTGTTWFIEGDVADCFGSLDHQIMIKTLAEKIRDNRFLRLMRNMLRAGRLEMERHAVRRSARRCSFTDSLQYIPAQARRLRREHAHPRIYQRGITNPEQGIRESASGVCAGTEER